MSELTPERRVGDRERRAVDDQLLAAVGDGVLTLAEYDERAEMLWRARTRTELDRLVVDLPSTARPVPPAVPGGPRPPARRIVAVMSEDRLAAPVLLGQDVIGWSVMGKAVLDLHRDDLPDEVHVRARTLMGEIEVLVPPGTTVHLSGASVMGERKVEIDGGGGSVVHLDAVAVMGSVKVAHGKGAPRPGDSSSIGLSRGTSTSPAVGGQPTFARRDRAGRLAGKIGSSAVALTLLLGVGGVIASGTDARAVFGSDEHGAGASQAPIQVSVLFGSVEVVVPDGTRVDKGGLVVFGSVECENACRGNGPVIDVRSLGGFGSVKILTVSEAEREQSDG